MANRSRPKFAIQEILTRPREFKLEWFVLQAECLSEFAIKTGSATALTYAALETRNSIEEVGFTLVAVTLAHSGRTEQEIEREFERCTKSSEGVFLVLGQLEPDYRTVVRFTNIAMEIEGPVAPRVIEWDIGWLRANYGKVSKFCHYRGLCRPGSLVADSKLFGSAARLIAEILHRVIASLSSGHSGMMRKGSMEPEVREAFDQFKSGILSVSDLRMKLKLMHGALIHRRRTRKSET